MHNSLQKEIMERLPGAYEEYKTLINDYEGFDFKTKLINYILEKHYGEKYGRNAKLEAETGINKDMLKRFRDSNVNVEMETYLVFAVGIGVTFDEGILLACESNISLFGDNEIAKASCFVLNSLRDEKTMRKGAQERANQVIKDFYEATKHINNKRARRKKYSTK